MAEEEITVELLVVERLFELVRDAFVADSSTTSVVFSRSAVTQQTNQGGGRANRVVFHRGDPTGKDGTFTGAVGKGFPPRIYTRVALFTLHLWAHDPTAGATELDHSKALRALVEVTANYIRESAMGRVRWKDAQHVIEPIERVFGAAMTYTLELDEPIEALPRDAIPAQPAEAPAVSTVFVGPSGEVPVCQPPEEP